MMKLVAWMTVATFAVASGAAEITVDCAKELGAVKRVQGLNAGPVSEQGMVDVSAYYKAMRVPLVRLHDCNWPNPDVVDVHAVFPNFAADENDPASYDFLRTDEYVRSVLATGAGIVYRLGESIEHGKDKRRCRPPADPEKWARACAHIVAHYNDGWANGFKYGIRYWEVWNEPENRPSCWTGTDEDYYRLYVATAKAIKARFPDVKVGGPAGGSVGKVDAKRGAFKPYPFISGFLERCKREDVALDFFSWHHYAADPGEFSPRARGVRAMLDAAGFAKTESHLNEWNWLPDADWTPVTHKGQGAARQRFFDRMSGGEAAAFVASAMIALQDEPVDVSNFYAGNTLGFGLFNISGTPRRSVFAIKAFAAVAGMPTRVGVTGGDAIRACAAKGKDEVRVLLANFGAKDGEANVTVKDWPWDGPAAVEEVRVDSAEEWRVTKGGRVEKDGRVTVGMKGPAVVLVTLKKAP
jgi:xylan 1,4-beta-xylosidase